MDDNRVWASAQDQSWNTPSLILDPVREFFGGRIDLDPCSNPTSIVGAQVQFIPPEQDAFTISWGEAKSVYANPPFGTGERRCGHNCGKKKCVRRGFHAPKDVPGLEQWTMLCLNRSKTLHRPEIILCIPAAVETRWWQNIIFPFSNGICWLKKRVAFLKQGQVISSGISKPIALVYFGDRGPAFGSHFRTLGRTYNPSVVHRQDPDVRSLYGDADNTLPPALGLSSNSL